MADHDIWIDEVYPITGQCAAYYRRKADRMGKPTNVPEHQYSHPFYVARYAVEGEVLGADGSGVDYIVLEDVS